MEHSHTPTFGSRLWVAPGGNTGRDDDAPGGEQFPLAILAPYVCTTCVDGVPTVVSSP